MHDIIRYESTGAIAAYEHCAMIRLHYRVADALDACLKKLESNDTGYSKVRQESPLFDEAQSAANASEPDIASLSTETSGTVEDDPCGAGFGETESYVTNAKRGLM